MKILLETFQIFLQIPTRILRAGLSSGPFQGTVLSSNSKR